MKITIDIDCTPEEARRFLGFPDFTPVHEAMVKRMSELASQGVKSEDLQTMMQSWMTGPMAQGFQDVQKAFWESALKGTKPSKKDG